MKIVILNKSDRTGGAAVVSMRLLEALRERGEDARMLVVEKLTDSPYVELAASPGAIKRRFLAERLKIFIANGLNRTTLFKIDTASDGLPLWRHPLVEGADLVLINWVNQGMLSLKGVRRILKLGKRVMWTMHDMWCMTGICHHAGQCDGFRGECGSCPLLKGAPAQGLAHKIWSRKSEIYSMRERITFVAVSRWLREKGAGSSLLRDADLTVIPNAFPLPDDAGARRVRGGDGRIRIGFGAARLDDPIKGLPVLVEMTRILRDRYPGLAREMRLVTFGGVKDPRSLEGMGIAHDHLGMVRGEKGIRDVYENTDIIVSSSSYETLPGTLVEAQAYGCIPVSFNQGGQSDIIDHLSTGYIAEYSDDIREAASRLAEGVVWAAGIVRDGARLVAIQELMREEVGRKFSPEAVAAMYCRHVRE